MCPLEPQAISLELEAFPQQLWGNLKIGHQHRVSTAKRGFFTGLCTCLGCSTLSMHVCQPSSNSTPLHFSTLTFDSPSSSLTSGQSRQLSSLPSIGHLCLLSVSGLISYTLQLFFLGLCPHCSQHPPGFFPLALLQLPLGRVLIPYRVNVPCKTEPFSSRPSDINNACPFRDYIGWLYQPDSLPSQLEGTHASRPKNYTDSCSPSMQLRRT